MRDIINKIDEIDQPVDYRELVDDLHHAIITACDKNNQSYNGAWIWEKANELAEQLAGGEGSDPEYGM